MTSVGCLALAETLPGLDGQSTLLALPGWIVHVTAGDGLRMAGSAAVLLLLWWPFALAGIVGAWLVFSKAGRPGWACLIPGYNGVEFLRIAKLPAWLWVLLLVPLANVVLFADACVRVARAFGKGPRFAAGLVLLPPVFMAVLGLGTARYRRLELVVGAAGQPDARASRGMGRTPRAVSPSAPKLVALPGRSSRTLAPIDCGAGETRVAAGGDRLARPRGQPCPPHGHGRPRLHLV